MTIRESFESIVTEPVLWLEGGIVDHANTNEELRTEQVHEWLKSLDDGTKTWFAINWKIPHTLFNLSCKFINPRQLQCVNWYKIHKSRDMGTFSHGGKVNCL
jgi:hypothetical protein